ncbi:MAG TPA: argininosuccinate synthase [Methanoregulaceae archaeon]|nr:argininosuccinate synthase [Methanoregulaceae archaeon]
MIILNNQSRLHPAAIFVATLVSLLVLAPAPALAEPTTSLLISEIGPDGTILNSTTVDYRWLEVNLPVKGDGVTHFYHQGPVFEGDKWDPNETVNLKDRGAVKGTNVADLCGLVGGLKPGDEAMVASVDGYNVVYGYDTIVNPPSRQGPLVVAWYNGADAAEGEKQGTGYPPDFYTGMRLIFFADTSTNPDGLHVFGNSDMRETLPESAQYFYNDLLPSTSGISVKWVSAVRLYRGGFKGDRHAPVKSLTNGTSAAAATTKPATTQAAGILPAVLLGIGGAMFHRRR